MEKIYIIVELYGGLFERTFAFRNENDAIKKWEELTERNYDDYDEVVAEAANGDKCEYRLVWAELI